MTKRDVIISCRSVIDQFLSSVQIAGLDALDFAERQKSASDRLEGMKILLSSDVPKWSVVCMYLHELKSYDLLNVSAVAARSPAHSAAELGQGGIQ